MLYEKNAKVLFYKIISFLYNLYNYKHNAVYVKKSLFKVYDR